MQTKSQRHSDKKRYDGNRIKALERDGYRCQRCGLTEYEQVEKYRVGLSVHHLDGKGLVVPKSERNNSLENLMTVCSPCHAFYENYHDLTITDVSEILYLHRRFIRELAEKYDVREKVIHAVLKDSTRLNHKNRASQLKYLTEG